MLSGYEQRVAAATPQPVARRHVQLDVGDDRLQPVARAQHLPHRAPALLELRLRHVGQAARLEVEPLVDPGRRREVLVDVARLVPQVQHHAVTHRLVVPVGVDVGAEGLDAPPLVGLQQRRAREPDQHGAGQEVGHRLVELPGLRAVTLVHEDEDLALRVEPVRHALPELRDVGLDVTGVVVSSEAPNLWISDAISHSVPSWSTRTRSAPLVVRWICSLTPRNTCSICSSSSVRSVMISTRAAGDALPDPLGQPDHGQALAAALRVPDDAAFPPPARAPAQPARRSTGCAGTSS